MPGALARARRHGGQRLGEVSARLLRRLWCANLVFCAVECAERKCVRAQGGMEGYFGHPDVLDWYSRVGSE